MNMNAEVFVKVCSIISAELGCAASDLVSSTTAEDIDGWDSLAHARLIMALEDKLEIRFPGEKLFDLDCVGDLVSLAEEALVSKKEGLHDVA